MIPLFYFLFIVISLFFTSCTTGTHQKENDLDSTVTNPLFTIAPIQYADSSEKAFTLMAAFKFDSWADMLADTVVYSFPDGDAVTRTTLHGKDTLVNWWKNWVATSGIQSMAMDAFNHVPIQVSHNRKVDSPWAFMILYILPIPWFFMVSPLAYA